jgi:hypothetical protein
MILGSARDSRAGFGDFAETFHSAKFCKFCPNFPESLDVARPSCSVSIEKTGRTPSWRSLNEQLFLGFDFFGER